MPIGRHLTRGPEGTLHVGGPLLAICWLIGWYFKDAHMALLWFYFIPPTAMVVFGLGWLAISHRKTWWPQRLFVLIVTLMALYQILLVDGRWTLAKVTPENTIRLVQWNTARRHRKAPEIFETISKDKADICVLSESPRVPNLYELGRTKLGLDYALDDQGMTIFSRYPLRPLGTVQITNGRVSVARVMTPMGELDIMAVDVISHPLINRSRSINELTQWVAAHDSKMPLIVAGDFNTNIDSLAFDSLRQYLREAYEVAGRGWPYSWPVPIPMYSIDHVWVSTDVNIVRQSRKMSLLSDHRRQLVDIRL